VNAIEKERRGSDSGTPFPSRVAKILPKDSWGRGAFGKRHHSLKGKLKAKGVSPEVNHRALTSEQNKGSRGVLARSQKKRDRPARAEFKEKLREKEAYGRERIKDRGDRAGSCNLLKRNRAGK